MFVFLKKECNINPNIVNYYKKALTHSSSSKTNNYEKLEFLGDSVLNTVVSEYLYLKFPQINEGELSQKRSVIVSRDNLNNIGKKLIPEELIKHKLKTVSKNIYGNILESLIGAIYLDLGYKKAKIFIEKNVLLDKEFDLKHYNHKSKILEWSQKNNKKLQFVNSKQRGPDHKKQYLIELYIDNIKISESWGETIKSAEQRSSKIAIKAVI